MKVLMLCKSLTLGGVEAHVLTLCEELRARGHQVWVISRKIGKEICALFDQMGVSWTERSGSGDVTELVKKEGIEIIHLHPWRKTLGIEKIHQATEVPLVVTCHGLAGEIIPLIAPLAAKILCVSEAVRQFVLTYDVPLEKCALVHNPINVDKFRPSQAQEEPGVIMFTGRLSKDKYKAANTLVEAVSGIRKAQLWILGDGNKRKSIHRHEKVRLIGAEYAPEKIMAKAMIICGESRVIMEAMALGKPALVLGNNGYLGPVSSKNFERLEHDNFMCLHKTFFDSEKLRNDLKHYLKHYGEREYNRVLAVNRYDARKITSAVLDLYQEALTMQGSDS